MEEQARGSAHVRCVGRSRLFVEPPIRFGGRFVIRSNTRIGAFAHFGREVEAQAADIGRYCAIGPGCVLGATGHPTTWLSVSSFQYKKSTWAWHSSSDATEIVDPRADGRQSFRSVGAGGRARIGNDVWLGANVVVLRGVIIGDGAIVAANAVVTKDVPPYTIYGGIPAKVIRPRVADHVREEMIALQWWRYSPNQLSGIPYDDPEAALKHLRIRVDGGLEPYDPGFVEITRPEEPPREVRRFFRSR